MSEKPNRPDSLRADRRQPNVARPSGKTMRMDQGEPEPAEPLADIFAPGFKYTPTKSDQEN